HLRRIRPNPVASATPGHTRFTPLPHLFPSNRILVHTVVVEPGNIIEFLFRGRAMKPETGTDDNDAVKDVVTTQSKALSVELEKAARADSCYVPPAGRIKRRARAAADKRFSLRKDLLESPRSDPHGFERVIGESDLLSIN